MKTPTQAEIEICIAALVVKSLSPDSGVLLILDGYQLQQVNAKK
jgi:hypothetical protein